MKPEEIKILIVNDVDTLNELYYNLSKESYKLYIANNEFDTLKLAKREQPHLIILDIAMPGFDGIDVCKILRKMQETENTVIAFLTSRDEDYSLFACFEAGADDCIKKPIQPQILISRIKALLRRYDDKTNNNIVGDLEIDIEQHTLINGGKQIELTKMEFKLLAFLFSNPGKVFKRDEIIHVVWGRDNMDNIRTIDVHIRKLRKKIGENYIKTIKGIGYKLSTKTISSKVST